jgi:hypothetical protein
MHRTTGPHRGYFIGVYTVKVKGGYVGYGKAFPTEPAPGWRNGIRPDVRSSVYPEAALALAAVEHKVRTEIDQLPPSWDPFTAPGNLVPDTRL